MTDSPSTPPKRASFARRSLKGLVLWGLLALCSFSALALAGLFLFCRFKPEIVAPLVQRQLEDSTGLPWQIRGAVYPVLFPVPGVEASDVVVLAASLEQEGLCDVELPLVRAEKVHIYFDVPALFHLEPRLSLVELEAPGINLTYDEQDRPLWLPLEPATPPRTAQPDAPRTPQAGGGDTAPPHSPPDRSAPLDADPGDPEDLFPVRPLPTAKGEALPEPAPRDPFQEAAKLFLRRPGLGFPTIRIQDGSLTSFTEKGEKLLSFTHVQAALSPRAERRTLTLSAQFSLPGADLEIGFTLEAVLGEETIPASGTISGDLAMTPPGSRTLRAEFASRFIWQADGRTLRLPGFALTSEGDGLTADLAADLAAFSCSGPVQLHKISLPRWFEWGRSLPPGLQQPMHRLVGEFDLSLDAHSAEALNLRGVVGPLAVSGYVGVQEFSEPVVVVDLDVDKANIDLIFPFLAKVGKYVPEPKAPSFDHPVLAPYPEDPAIPPAPPSPDDIDISYDVKVRVAHPEVHDVQAGPIEVLVFPVRVNKVDKTRVAFPDIAVIKGKVSGVLDIDDDSILMRYDIAGLELGLLPENKDNSVRIAGRLTGKCDIAMPMRPDGSLLDLWPMTVNAAIQNCDITGSYENAPWRLFAGTAKAAGKGTIFSVLSKGVRIEGLWDVAAQGMYSSWNPKGADKLAGKFNGGLFWPPITAEAPPSSPRGKRRIQRKGVEKVAGQVALEGGFTTPLGNLLVPVTGSLNTRLDWLLYGQTIDLSGYKFQGFGSYSEGEVHIDYSGKDILFKAETSFKMNPGEVLRRWDCLPPEGLVVPRVLTGKTAIAGKRDSLIFDKLKVELDGAPISGDIQWQRADNASREKSDEDSGIWTFHLNANHLDLDNFFPPPPKDAPRQMPSTAPWRLGGLKGLGLDIHLFLRSARYRNLSVSQAVVKANLLRDRFSLHADMAKFYDGSATLLLQGTIVPEAPAPAVSQISLRKGLFSMKDVSLGKVMYDYTKERHYAGTAELVVDVAGTMSRNADVPAKLSGIWNMRIADGLYPAFLSNEKSTLRNTFSKAGAGGAIRNGVIMSDNFVLSGPMVDMQGGGRLNMNTTEIDMDISVTFAKIPTIPVHFSGTTDKPQMRVRGVNMVVETVQAAGVGVFSLVKNILELPAHAVRGINSLVEKEKSPAEAPKAPAEPQKSPVHSTEENP